VRLVGDWAGAPSQVKASAVRPGKPLPVATTVCPGARPVGETLSVGTAAETVAAKTPITNSTARLPATLRHARTWQDQMPIHDVRPPHAADPDIRSPRRQPCTIPREKPSTLSLRQRCTERAGDGLVPLPGSPHYVCRTRSSGTVGNWVGCWVIATGMSALHHPQRRQGHRIIRRRRREVRGETKRRAGQTSSEAGHRLAQRFPGPQRLARAPVYRTALR